MKIKKTHLPSITALSFSLLLFLNGCGQISTANNPISQSYTGIMLSKNISTQNAGSLKLNWKSAQTGFSTQAVRADIQNLRLTLSGTPIEEINNGQSMELNLAFAQGGQTLRNIPKGTIHLKATALNASGQEIGSTEANNIVISPDVVAQVNLAMQLSDTVVTQEVTNTGNLGLSVDIQDGNQVVNTHQVTPQEGYVVIDPPPAGQPPQGPPPPAGAQPPAGQPPQGPPPPPPPAGTQPPASGAPTGDYSSCPKPPLPPPEVMTEIEAHDATLAQELRDLQNLSFLEIHNGMVELAAEYPGYLMAPPALPADGSCPPPPPAPPEGAPPAGQPPQGPPPAGQPPQAPPPPPPAQ
jgi:hypothetical protein